MWYIERVFAVNNEEKILSLLETVVVKMDKLETDVSDLKQGQARLEADVTGLKQGQAKLEEGQARLSADVSLLKEDMTFVKDRVTIIEVEHGENLAALGDGYKMLYDISKDVRGDIASMHNKLDEHNAYINALWRDKLEEEL